MAISMLVRRRERWSLEKTWVSNSHSTPTTAVCRLYVRLNPRLITRTQNNWPIYHVNTSNSTAHAPKSRRHKSINHGRSRRNRSERIRPSERSACIHGRVFLSPTRAERDHVIAINESSSIFCARVSEVRAIKHTFKPWLHPIKRSKCRIRQAFETS